jgi:tetratricopeptide (TPR) repeat protein
MKHIFLFLFVCLGLFAFAQSEHALVTEATTLEKALNEPAALEKWKQVARINPANYTAMCKSSELYSRLGIAQPGTEGKMSYYRLGKNYADAAIKLKPAEAEGYYVLSVAMGRLAMTGPNKEKIAAVKAIKANAEKAIRLNPAHGRAWHVLGKWHYEVSGLNFMERTAVKLFYGGFPESSIEASIQAYEKTQQLEPNFALNHLELAKAYHRAGKDAKAKALLQRLFALPNKTGDDNRIKSEGKALLKEWD